MQVVGSHVHVAGVFGEQVPDCTGGQILAWPCWSPGSKYLEGASITAWQVALSITVSAQLQVLIAPIEALLGAKGEVRWTCECTASLNAIMMMILMHLRISTSDAKLPYRLHPDFDSKFSIAALM